MTQFFNPYHRPWIEEDEDARPSRSQKKREASAQQAVGEELTRLASATLQSMDLPLFLLEEILDYQEMTHHEAKRRQMQLIGKMMREVDSEAIAAKIEEVYEPSKEQNNQLHKLEQMRDNLISGGPSALSEVVEQYPDVDVQRMNHLIRTANREAKQEKPPKAKRQLFKYLKELTGA